jgi:hypothetical protein
MFGYWANSIVSPWIFMLHRSFVMCGFAEADRYVEVALVAAHLSLQRSPAHLPLQRSQFRGRTCLQNLLLKPRLA